MTITNMKLKTSGLEQRNRVTTNGASSIILELNRNNINGITNGAGQGFGGLFLVQGSLRPTSSSNNVQLQYQLFASDNGSGTALTGGFSLNPDSTTGFWRFETNTFRMNYWTANSTDASQINFMMDIDTWSRPNKYPGVNLQTVYKASFDQVICIDSAVTIRTGTTQLIESIKFFTSSGNLKGEVSATPVFSPYPI